jgi:hypothetical protein
MSSYTGQGDFHFVDENNHYEITFDLVDDNDDAIALSSLGTFNLTLYYYNTEIGTSDRNHLATINNRLYQDVKNDNNVVVSSAGTVHWSVQSEDNPKLDSSATDDTELHIALFQWYWSGKTNSQEIKLNVRKVAYSQSG